MSYDIYGNPLQRGHCEVHPHVHEEYPCSVCIQENNNRNAQQQSESEHYEMMRLEHELELSQQRIAELEQRESELSATVERLKANLKIAMSVVDEVVQSAIECSNIEANDLQEWLVKEGVLKVIPFDPAKHFDYTYETEKGEDWITWSDWYEKMKEQSDE